MSKKETANISRLARALCKIQSEPEMIAFMEDICTHRELRELSNRLTIAEMLSSGNIYNDIVGSTGASTATVSRVNKALLYGKGGYAAAFRAMRRK